MTQTRIKSSCKTAHKLISLYTYTTVIGTPIHQLNYIGKELGCAGFFFTQLIPHSPWKLTSWWDSGLDVTGSCPLYNCIDKNEFASYIVFIQLCVKSLCTLYILYVTSMRPDGKKVLLDMWQTQWLMSVVPWFQDFCLSNCFLCLFTFWIPQKSCGLYL